MVAIYARQSLDKKDSISIETQVEHCKRILIENEPCKVYIDKGWSGGNTCRPDFLRMMEDIRRNSITRVIVYKLDRISRSILDFALMMEEFQEHNTDFVSTVETFDTSTPMGRAMLSICIVFAQLERETIQLRTRDSYHARSGRGSYDAKAPYGYIKTTAKIDGKKMNTLQECPTTGDILRRIFQQYAASADSLGYLARKLNSEGVPSPEGKAWDGQKLSRIMANPIYVRANADIYTYYKAQGIGNITNDIEEFDGKQGCITYGAWDRQLRKFKQPEKLTLSLGLHEGIIDAETFLRCQYKLSDNKQILNTGAGKHTWLTGLVKCGLCGYALKVQAQGNTPPVFRCSGRTNAGVCEGTTVKVAEVEDAVALDIIAYAEKAKGLRAQRIDNYKDEIDRLKINIAKIKERKERIVEAIAEAEGPIAELSAKLLSLEKEEARQTQEMQRMIMKSKQDDDVKQLFDLSYMWEGMSMEQKREMAFKLIERIEITENETKIVYLYEI